MIHLHVGEAQQMVEESDCRAGMALQTRKMDAGCSAMNVEELLRMLEAAVEKEFVGMKKTCEGLGANSNYMQLSKNDGETRSSSSAGTPNSMYSACSASGSIFSRCSYGKEKVLPLTRSSGYEHAPRSSMPCAETCHDEELRCSADEPKVNTKSEARVEATLDTVHDSQLDDVSEGAVSVSRSLTEDFNNDNFSTSEEIVGNPQSRIHETLGSDAYDSPNDSTKESITSEVKGVHNDHDDLTHDPSTILNESVKNVVTVACSSCDFPFTSENDMGTTNATRSSTRTSGAHAQCVSEDSLNPSEKILVGDASSNFSEHDSPDTPVKPTEKEIDESVCGTTVLFPDLDQAHELDTAFDSSTDRVEGIVFTIRDIYNEFANETRTSLSEGINTVDRKYPNIFSVTDDRVGMAFSTVNTRSTAEETEESARSCNSHDGLQAHGTLSEGQERPTCETEDRMDEPCSSGRKDRVLRIKHEVQLNKVAADDLEVNVRKVDTSTTYLGLHIEPEDSPCHLVTPELETVILQECTTPEALDTDLDEMEDTHIQAAERSITADEYFQEYCRDSTFQRHNSAPEVRGRVLHETLIKATDHEVIERSITADEYFQKYCQDARPQQHKSTVDVPKRVLGEGMVEATDHGVVERSVTAHEYFQEYGRHARPQTHKSTPDVLGGVLDEMLVEATDYGVVERSITAHEYFRRYCRDEARLVTVSDLTHASNEYQCFLSSELETSSWKKKSMKVDEVTQGAEKDREASKWLSEYHLGLQGYGLTEMRIAEDPAVASDHKITTTADLGQVHRGDPVSVPHTYSEEAKLAKEDDVVQHSVSFGSSCCSPSRRDCVTEVQSRQCCCERTSVRDCLQAAPAMNQNNSIFSSSTFLEMEKAAASGCVLGTDSQQFANWNKVDSRRSSDSCNPSTNSFPSETFFDRILRYGRSVRNKRATFLPRAVSDSLGLSELAGQVTETSKSRSTTPTQFGGPNHREKVKVVVRMRPFAEHEKMCPVKQILCLPEDKVMVKENNTGLLKHNCPRSKDGGIMAFKVDKVVDDSYLEKHRWDKKAESQKRMYELIGLPCLEYALDGYNTTIIAYGQAGSGKTYSIMGDDTVEGRGIMPRLAEELMNQINTEFRDEFIVQVSYLEIYQERIRDLLVPPKAEPETTKAEWQGCADSRCGSVNGERRWTDSLDDNVYEELVDGDTASYLSFGTCTSSRRAPSVCFDYPSAKNSKEYLKVREHPVMGPYVEGLLWKDIYTWDDMEQVILEGAGRRTVGSTPSNRFSNRGHTVFAIRLFKEQGGRSSKMRLINLVDLAGTEKPNCTKKVSMERLYESRYINRSMAHLNDMILNLSKNSKFVSYRNSPLTKLLRDSLGGNYKTFLIAHLSPAEQDVSESVNTLRYAAKASHIQSTIDPHRENKKGFMVNKKKLVKASERRI